MTVYVVEALCIPTNEVWYGCRTEPFDKFVGRLRNAADDALGRVIARHGFDSFKFTRLGVWMRQAPAIAFANQKITRAMKAGRNINPRLLTINNKRNAKH